MEIQTKSKGENETKKKLIFFCSKKEKIEKNKWLPVKLQSDIS